MGTVGLSFGSPFSGQGFNVSSTVSAIMANLDGVETPWKTQITTIGSQDTVLSSLGTLLSNLSTDMSSLTSSSGILAQKEGSSSNTSALELTAASNTAVAGTHTVVVNALATTSSGVLTEITNASDTLSGSIVVQVGSAAAQTVTLSSSDNTLAGLAAALNASGIGVTASVLTDSTGSQLSIVSGTSGLPGELKITSSISDVANSSSPVSLTYGERVAGLNGSIVVDGVALTVSSNTVNDMIPGVTFQLLATTPTDSSGNVSPVQVVIANYNSGVESTVNSLVTDYNSLISAINVQEGKDSSGNSEPLYGSPTLSMLQQDILGGVVATNPNGYLDSVSAAANTTISGSIVIQVGTATAQTISLSSGQNSISALAAAINAQSIGVTAGVVNLNGASTLTLTSGTIGTSGALAVTSGIEVTAPTALTFTDTGGTNTYDSGTIGALPDSGDILSGSLVIRVGSGSAQTITVSSSSNTLGTLADAINTAAIGVTASVVTDSTGNHLNLVSNTAETAGTLAVSSTLNDLTSTTTTPVNYNFSSDITSLTMLGISVNSDGSLSLDAASLDALLNTDYSGVAALFQNANSWGTSFSKALDNMGSSSSTGIVKLALDSSSSIESTLNADISREDMLISSESKSMTTELNSANETLQELPSLISQVNELYSAVSGYNQSSS
jgi:flagellar hook-associated protein 2